MTVSEAAKLLECAPSTVYDLCRTGQLGHYRIGRLVRIEAQDLDRFKAEARRQPGPRPGSTPLRHIKTPAPIPRPARAGLPLKHIK
jgi:putative molybdopterin biosynthesis protein